jgi:DNA polymerase-1
MSKTMLLDADIPVFQFAAKAQSENPSWDVYGEMETTVLPIEEVAPELDSHIEHLMNRAGCDEVIVCLSEPDREKNWRRGVLPTYKDTRKGTVSPVLRQPLTDYLAEAYTSYLKPTLEGDDVLGILATNPKVIKGDKVIVSEDKDMRTIPSRETPAGVNYMFNPAKDSEPYLNPEWLADYYWLYQTLIGDTTDGYTGLPKCGPAAALKWLDIPKPTSTVDVLWPRVVQAYEDKGLTEEDALVQARVARILRTEDFNYGTKRAKLWTP